jgi:hypothetical protein
VVSELEQTIRIFVDHVRRRDQQDDSLVLIKVCHGDGFEESRRAVASVASMMAPSAWLGLPEVLRHGIEMRTSGSSGKHGGTATHSVKRHASVSSDAEKSGMMPHGYATARTSTGVPLGTFSHLAALYASPNDTQAPCDAAANFCDKKRLSALVFVDPPMKEEAEFTDMLDLLCYLQASTDQESCALHVLLWLPLVPDSAQTMCHFEQQLRVWWHENAGFATQAESRRSTVDSSQGIVRRSPGASLAWMRCHRAAASDTTFQV